MCFIVRKQSSLLTQSPANVSRKASKVVRSILNACFVLSAAIHARTKRALRCVNSNSARSRFDETKISIDGDGVLTNGRFSREYEPVAINCARTLFSLLAHISKRMGTPICLA